MDLSNIGGKTLGWFAIAVIFSIFLIAVFWFKTNNHYRVRKKQTHGANYYNEMFRLWLPFAGIILLSIGLCALPFYADLIFN